MTQDLRPVIREAAREYGFDAVGFARLGEVSDEHQSYLDHWLEEGKEACMSYMSRNFEVRKNPIDKILPGARSVIVVAASYYPVRQQPKEAPQVAKYAYGPDYHDVLTEALVRLGEGINDRVAPHSFRCISGSVPFLERYWASEAGIGFIGKNRCMIIPGMGSFFFLAEMLTTLDLESEHPVRRPLCGTCHRCRDACPTGALSPEGMDARRCISYLTVEHHDEVSLELTRRMGNRLFGCDSCQDACPFNRQPKPTKLFPSYNTILDLRREDITEMSLEDYHRIFQQSPARRANYKWMTRNCRLWLENNPPHDTDN